MDGEGAVREEMVGLGQALSPAEPRTSDAAWRVLRLLPLLAALVAVPTAAAIVREQYWEGSAPLCWGVCHGPYRVVQSDPCGDGSCCWLGHKTLCRVNCGPPGHVENGHVYGNDWWVGSVVRYRCAPGFAVIGDPTRKCLPAGHWSPGPTCARTCASEMINVDVNQLSGGCPPRCPADDFDPLSAAQLGCSELNRCTDSRPAWLRWAFPCAQCLCRCFTPCGHTGPPPVQDSVAAERRGDPRFHGSIDSSSSLSLIAPQRRTEQEEEERSIRMS